MLENFSKLILENLSELSISLIWAILVLLAGWFVAKWIGKLTWKFLEKIRLNQLLKRIGFDAALTRIDMRLSAPKFFGELVRWFFFAIFLMVASEILELGKLSQFLEKVIGYYPNLFIASFIFIVAVFLTDLSQKIIVGTFEKEKIIYSAFLGRLIRWSIWFFAALAILYQLKITSPLILTIFITMAVAFSIAVGIAFGLGGKEIAAKILKEFKDKFK